jgi:YD repeat-containing protein
MMESGKTTMKTMRTMRRKKHIVREWKREKMSHGNGLKYVLWGLLICLAACRPAEELVETGNLITRAEMFNEKNGLTAYSDFTYNGRGQLLEESHYNGSLTTKTVLDYDEDGRLKTRTDDSLGPHPVRLEYAYAADGKTVNVKRTREGEPAREMNNLLEGGVLVGRNWGKDGKNTLAFKIERVPNQITRYSFTGDSALRSTEVLFFNERGQLVGLAYASDDLTETRLYEYDGDKLVRESVRDGQGKTQVTIKYYYGTAKVLPKYARVRNYLHLDTLLNEVGGKKPEGN